MEVDAPASSSPQTTSSAPTLTPPEPTEPTEPTTPPTAASQPTTAHSNPSDLTPESTATTKTPVSQLIHNLILSYLIHNCYEKTALALISAQSEFSLSPTCSEVTDANGDITVDVDVNFDNAKQKFEPMIVSPTKLLNDFHLSARQKMMTCVIKGDIQPALTLANSILQSHKKSCTLQAYYPEAYSRALCQHYVELMRANENESALTYARTTISPFCKQYDEAFVRLEKHLPLLAYPKPELSPLFELLDESHRTSLAEYLNGCTVACLTDNSDAFSTITLLERFIRQLIHVMRKLKGENWSLNDIWDDDAKMDD